MIGGGNTKQSNTSIRKILHDLDKPLLIVSIIFFVFGLLNIVTASSRAAVVNYDVSIYYYFFRQLIFIIVGLIIAVFILKTDTKYYKLLVWVLFAIAIILNLWALSFEAISGSKNWINLPLFNIQPSELSKPILIALLAILYEKNYRKLRTINVNRWNTIGFIILISAIIPLIVFLQQDFGTLLIICFIIGMMFLAGPFLRIDKLKMIAIFIVVIGIALGVMYYKQGYILNDARMSRFSSFLNPCANYENGGYQVCNSFIAINEGGINGLGLGKSKQKYSYIPEPHTDSVFAIIAEENGLKSIIIFLGYAIILWRIFKIASEASSLRGRYLCFGIGCYIFAHVFINLGGLLGVIPLTGVPLPFFSYGGSFVLSLLASLAIVQRVNIETKNKKIKVAV